MNPLRCSTLLLGVMLAGVMLAADPAPLPQEPNTWVKRSPLKDGPPSPGMGYEASLGYDPQARVVIRWGGHNQGGGGEQNAELWTFDPVTAKWTLKEPNTSPPGVCCAQQNVFDPVQNRFLRFPAFSGSHGWQWFREIYLNNSTLWTYDLAKNTWRDMRPIPTPRVAPLRCAAWDSEHQVAVVFGGEGSSEGTLVYDPYTNTWTRMKPPKEPDPRSAGNLAYDAARKLHILFGAQFQDDPHTWAYNLIHDEWHDLKPAAQPPTNRNDAVLAYDSVNEVVVAMVRVADKQDGNDVSEGHLETWVYDAGKNTWTRMKPNVEPGSWRSRRRIMVAVPDQNLILMESYVNPTDRLPNAEREQQIWSYRYGEAKKDPRPLPPTGLTVTTTASGATLKWQRSASPGVTSYVIFRGEAAQPWLANYKSVGQSDKDQTAFTDTELKPGAIYHYFVSARTANGLDSADSVKVRTQPRIVEDIVVSMVSPTEARLSWTPPPGQDIAGYHVERAIVEVFTEDQVLRLKKDTAPLAEPSVGAIKAIGKFARLNQNLIKEATFTDPSLDLTKPQTVDGEPLFQHRFREDQLDASGKAYRYGVYAYRVRAVNVLGVESGPSPYFLTIPSAPQWLFSKEDGEQCQLKWKDNPGQGIKGYRVHRMESPRINGPGQPVTRLTADPVAEPGYVDAKAGQVTRRYWVVAVDGLGQEGYPSAPTWHYREYRRFYVPFVGEWHQ